MLTFIIGWIIIGLIAGFLANLLMHAGHGMIFDLLLGLVGAVIGGIIIGAILGFHTDSLIGHIVVAFIGAVIAIGVVRLFERRSVFG